MTLFRNTFLPFCPIFVASLPFLLLRPNSCGPVTFGLQALVELHMRLQENSEYKLSRALNTNWFSQKVEPADKLLHIQYLEKRIERWYSRVKEVYSSKVSESTLRILRALLKQSQNNQQEKEKKHETRGAAHYFLVDLRPDWELGREVATPHSCPQLPPSGLCPVLSA